MQWSFSGEVNWAAPRVGTLGFIPVLGAGLLGLVAFFALNVPPRAGQEGAVLPAMLLIGAAFIGVQLLHLRLIERTLRRGGD